MTESNQNAFFATQINQQDEEQQNLNAENNNIETGPQINKPQQVSEQQIVDLKILLQHFNSFDKNEKGLITQQECIKIIDSFDHVPKTFHEKIDIYFQLCLASENKLSFDQFLFVFGLCEFGIESKTIDEQYDYCKTANPKIIDYLRLLTNYRKKCQKQSVYQQAKKSKDKVQQVREKQYRRRKNYLTIINQKQLQALEAQQKQKFVQFCQTWDEFMNEYEQTASQLVKRLSQNQQESMKEFIRKTKQQLASKVRFSKKVVELQNLQKILVKSQEYQKADKIKIEIQQLKIFELQKKEKQDNSLIQLRAQTVKKQHIAAMNTLLQKIQKDRNDQSKQRSSDSEKLIVKSKSLVSEVKHRHTQALKRLYQSLHNVTIDENRLNLQQSR